MQNTSNPRDPDQDQRDTGNVLEDSNAKTVEFLRARLLAERTVSKAARERADELAKRIVELEEQLKIVSLQRKKAEKATADVLAILEDRGLSDFSEEIDSSSDQEIENDFQEESLVDLKIERNQRDDISGFEIETSSLPGRSLSWKSGRDSPSSGNKKYINSQKRSPFASPSFSSPRRSASGKSCRRIRSRETRSADEEPINGSKQTLPENGDASEIPGNSSENQNLNFNKGGSENMQPEGFSSNDVGVHNSSIEMERALENQAQLIRQYEEEENAQKEWEDKFRENNISPVSCERVTTRSDLTEERDDFEAGSAPNAININDSVDFKAKVQSSFIKKLGDHQPAPLVSLSKGENTSRSTQSHDSLPRVVPDNVGPVLQALQQAKLLLNHKLKSSSPSNSVSHVKAIEFPAKDRPEVPIGYDTLFKVPPDFYPQVSNSRLSLTSYPHKGAAINSANQFITSRSIDPHLGSSLDSAFYHPNNFKNSDLNINGDVRPTFDRGVPFTNPYMYNSPNMDPNSIHSSYAPPNYLSNTNSLLQMPYGRERQFSSTDISRVPTRPPYGGERPFITAEMNNFSSSYAVPSYPLYRDPMSQTPSGRERLFSSSGSGVGRADLSFYDHIRPDMYR